MVFKPTQGRKVFTQPTGMPDLSGFKSAAKSYQQLGGIIAEFGTQKRVGDYNEAVRQAQIDGKTAGVKYTKGEDGQWKLSPLVNLDYSKAVQGLPEQDRQGVLDAHRQAAVGTYVAAAVNDINSAATRSLIDNPNDPDRVRADMNGYAQGLRDSVDESIYAQIAPKIEGAFLSAENQAFAQQQKEITEEGIAALTQKYNSNTKDLGNLYAVGPVEDDDASVEGFEMRLSEIVEEDEVTLKHLETLGKTESEIQALRDTRANNIAQRVGSSFVEKTWIESEGDLEKTLLTVRDIVKEAQFSEQNIDTDALTSSLRATATQLDQLDKAAKAEDSQRRDNIFQDYQHKIFRLGEDLNIYLADPNSTIHELLPSQVGSLLSVSDAKRDQYINDYYNENFGLVQNWEQTIGTDFEKNLGVSYDNIYQMWKNGDIAFDKFASAKESYSDYLQKKFIDPNLEIVELSVVRELGAGSSYANPPEFYQKLGPELVKRGVIGRDGGEYSDLVAYEKAVGTYAGKYIERNKELRRGRAALSQLQNGVMPLKEDMEYIHAVTPEFRAVMPDGVTTEADFFTDNEMLFQASVDAADRFAHQSGGLLMPSAKRLFDNAYYNEENADKAMRVLGQVVTGMAISDRSTTDEQLNHFFDVNNFDEEQRAFFNISYKVGIKNAMSAREGLENVGKNKGIERRLGNRAKGELLDQEVDKLFNDTFTEALQSHSWWRLVNPMISESRQAQIEEFAASAGLSTSQIANAIIRDPEVADTLKGIWLDRWHNMKGEGTAVEIMRSSLQSLGKRFGYEEDTRTGQIHLVERPIIHYAQATVPGKRLRDGTIIPSVDIDMGIIEEDVVKKFLMPKADGAFRNPDVDRAVADVLNKGNSRQSDISFHANMSMGGEQTYTVVVTDADGKPHVIAKDYSYDFGTSVQNEYYQKVMSELKSSKIKQIWSVYGLFDKGLIQGAFENYHRNGSDTSLQPVINALNELYFNTHEGVTPEFLEGLGSPLKLEDVQDLMRVWNNVISFGKL